MFKNLSEFINHLEQIGELKRVKTQVSSILEMTEIQNRLIKQNGPAVLFENVITENGKSEFPVLVNLFGKVERIALALNTKPEKLRELGETLAFLRQPQPPESLKEAFKMEKSGNNTLHPIEFELDIEKYDENGNRLDYCRNNTPIYSNTHIITLIVQNVSITSTQTYQWKRKNDSGKKYSD